jgi:diketogulonate reductase-like aldo/keto reductase
MAYTPIEQGSLLEHAAILQVAERHHVTAAQVALSWVMRHPHVNTIPKAGTPEHVRENRQALDLQLTKRDLQELDAAFRPPTHRVPLEEL